MAHISVRTSGRGIYDVEISERRRRAEAKSPNIRNQRRSFGANYRFYSNSMGASSR